MPQCQNCGSHVTEQYIRVFSKNGADHVDACPDCPDLKRANGKPREKKYTENEDAAIAD